MHGMFRCLPGQLSPFSPVSNVAPDRQSRALQPQNTHPDHPADVPADGRKRGLEDPGYLALAELVMLPERLEYRRLEPVQFHRHVDQLHFGGVEALVPSVGPGFDHAVPAPASADGEPLPRWGFPAAG